MKRLAAFFVLLFVVSTAFAQEKLPNVVLKDINGNAINLSELSNNGKPIVINFWATWCAPCKRELNTISELYTDWVEETGVKIYAVSVDDQRTVDKVKPYVDASGWEYEILLDTNGDLKRALGINNVPFTLLLDGKGNIVWKHNNYNPGDEEELYKKIVELSAE
jgi:cytochrome c biogenesis protein CcmG, thiol:disulfide interchange protein DsbE